MKKITVFLGLMCAWVMATHASVTIENSKVVEVTIYRNYAKETRVGSASIPEGNSEVILTNVSNLIDENSIQVGSKGSDIKILSVSTRINYLVEPNKLANPTKVKIWQDSVKLLQNDAGFILKEMEVYRNSLQLLYSNNKLGNEQEGLKPDLLKQLLELNFAKQLELNRLLYDAQLKYNEMQETIATLNNQIYQGSSNGTSKSVREIVLKVYSKEAKTVAFKASYLITTAYWVPTYEIRCANTTKPLELSCRAKIVQNSGYDWKDVKVKLSTANPNQNHSRPILYPIFVDFMQPDYFNQKLEDVDAYKPGLTKSAEGLSNTMNIAYGFSGDVNGNYNLDDFKNGLNIKDNNVTVHEGDMMVEYDIEDLQDIESDGKEHIVAIQEISLPAIYNYHAVPKLDVGAFLLARVTDWGKYNLLAGETTIFFDDMYVGKSYINPNVSADTLLISLGRDEKVNVKRNKLNDYAVTKVVGSKKRETKAYEIIVKNNKSYPIEIEVLDQYPISKTDDIEVTLDETGGALIVEEYGKLTWNLKLQPGESKKLKFVYTIKYPEDLNIYEHN